MLIVIFLDLCSLQGDFGEKGPEGAPGKDGGRVWDSDLFKFL